MPYRGNQVGFESAGVLRLSKIYIYTQEKLNSNALNILKL